MENRIATMLIALAIGTTASFSQTQKTSAMKKFNVNISANQITELKQRLGATRWIQEAPNAGWGNPALEVITLRDIASYWANSFDWKKQEARINSFQQYTVKVNDLNVHFVLEIGSGNEHIPVLLLHGWASNFTEFLSVAESLKKEHPQFDIIIPSLPGFGFSDTPASMSSETTAAYIHTLMTEILGYKSYFIHGGDYGSFVAEKAAFRYPETVEGIHLSDIPYYHLYSSNENLSEAERKLMEKINQWSMMDGTYAMIQATKPKILSTGLNDSPAALMAWFLQLYNDFGDKEKTLIERFSKDELLTNVALYWFNEKIYSSMRIYSEDTGGFGEAPTSKVAVPVGFNFQHFDITGVPPKEFANRFFLNIVHWSEGEGGHFAGYSEGKQISNDIATFVKKVRK
jgi:pimeloyl-ACP methyl ester carboxylesterase